MRRSHCPRDIRRNVDIRRKHQRPQADVQAVVCSIVWAFRWLKKPRCQEVSARSYALQSVHPQIPFLSIGLNESPVLMWCSLQVPCRTPTRAATRQSIVDISGSNQQNMAIVTENTQQSITDAKGPPSRSELGLVTRPCCSSRITWCRRHLRPAHPLRNAAPGTDWSCRFLPSAKWPMFTLFRLPIQSTSFSRSLVKKMRLS